jgi:hypothetical protein
MANKLHHARVEERDSVFPTREGPSFCSRPTPVVPANPELIANDERPDAGTHLPSTRPSDRPTFVPDDYVEPRIESPPVVTVGDPTPLDGSDETFPAELATNRTESGVIPVPAPALVAVAEVPTLKPAEGQSYAGSGRGRVYFSRLLFVVLFGAVGTLLGYAFKPQFEGALEQLRGSSAHAVK